MWTEILILLLLSLPLYHKIHFKIENKYLGMITHSYNPKHLGGWDKNIARGKSSILHNQVYVVARGSMLHLAQCKAPVLYLRGTPTSHTSPRDTKPCPAQSLSAILWGSALPNCMGLRASKTHPAQHKAPTPYYRGVPRPAAWIPEVSSPTQPRIPVHLSGECPS